MGGMDTEPLVLGNPEDATTEESLRDGAVRFRSRKGVRTTERLLIEALPAKAPGRLLTGFDTEGATALAARALWGGETKTTWWHLDAYVAAKVRRSLARHEVADVDVRCTPDLPGAPVPGEPPPEPADAPFDLVALPFPKTGESQLGRELIEEAHAILKPGGRLLAATDDKKGEWLNRVLRDVFGNSSISHTLKREGVCFMSKRTKAKAEVRDHHHEIRARLRDRALLFESRPGTFGYRGLDAGTRALADGVEVREGDVALDIGCGYGAIGVAIAPVCARVVMIDSSSRAVALAVRNAARNGAANAEVLLRADVEDPTVSAFDLVVTNPPYYSNWRIAQSFVASASAVLKPGGRLWIVAKAAGQHAELLTERFKDVRTIPTESGHSLITGVQPG